MLLSSYPPDDKHSLWKSLSTYKYRNPNWVRYFLYNSLVSTVALGLLQSLHREMVVSKLPHRFQRLKWIKSSQRIYLLIHCPQVHLTYPKGRMLSKLLFPSPDLRLSNTLSTLQRISSQSRLAHTTTELKEKFSRKSSDYSDFSLLIRSTLLRTMLSLLLKLPKTRQLNLLVLFL